jgi:tetratricopeptide (TPR) repeat protein
MVDLLYDWNVGNADTELSFAGAEKRALTVLSCTSHLMQLSGHGRNAEEQLDSLLAYDPQNVGLIGELGCVAYYRHRFEEAIRHYRLAQEMDPTSPLPYWGMAKSFSQEGRYRESIAALDQFRERNGFEPVLITAERGYALGLWGKRSEAEAVVKQLLEKGKTSFVDPYLISIVYLASDNRPMTFEWLEKAYDVRSSFLISILTEPKWAKVQDDARFQAMVEKIRSHQ